ncbi:MAG: InlB B-repeat-containing protein [Spirochaetaceae bacterium]|jgi:uncharacterized repeat protein (TIGR02543 family)|nr:InlB B-repeat-containing protein [Spirochaetaceae bacterium]
MEKFFIQMARFGRTAVFLAAATLVFVLAGCPNLSGDGELEQYTITFDSREGSAVQPVTAAAGAPVPQPNDPERTGYDFQGWYSAASGGTLYSWPHTLTADVMMYARWKVKLSAEEQAAVDNFTNDETVKEALSQDAGGIGLDFPEDNLADLEGKVDEALAAYDALSSREQEVLSEEKAKLDAIKEKIENVNTAHDFQDTYEKALEKKPDDIKGLDDATALLPDLTKALEEANGLPEAVKILLAEDIAHLESLKEKAEEIAAENAPEEDRAAAEKFRKDHAEILGKSSETVGLDDETVVEAALLAYEALGDVVKALLLKEYNLLTGLKARIVTLKTRVITFDSQGGSAVQPVTAAAGTQVPKPGNPTREGYVFQGWYNAPSNGTEYVWPYTLTENITMYAQWERPSLTGTVVVSGVYDVDKADTAGVLVLTANTTGLGGSGAIRYQWQRADSATGSFAGISGAIGETYTLIASDDGHYIRVTVSRVENSGTISSAAVGPVKLPGITGTVSITGSHDAQGGSDSLVLTANTTGLGGSGPISYWWQRSDSSTGNFADIDGATGGTYTLVAPDQGKYIRVTVSRMGYTGVKSSASAGPVVLPNLSGTVTITGDAKVHLLLEADITSLSGSNTAINYSWQRSDSGTGGFVDIPGAKAETYTLAMADNGKYIRVVVTRTGYAGTVTSSATAQVTLQAPGNKTIDIGFNYGDISISGSDGTNVIYKASAAPNSVTLSAADYEDVQWYVDGGVFPAGTGDSITLSASDYSAKTHSITFTGKKYGKLYSQVIPFTVKN